MLKTKEQLTIDEWDSLPKYTRDFIKEWRRRTNRINTHTPTLGEVLDIHRLVCRSHHREESPAHQYYNNAIIGTEFAVYFEGDELIDIALFEVSTGIKRLMLQYVRT